jgi:hypothetical protein
MLVVACASCYAENLACGFEDVEHLQVPGYCVVCGYGPYFSLNHLRDICYGIV